MKINKTLKVIATSAITALVVALGSLTTAHCFRELPGASSREIEASYKRKPMRVTAYTPTGNKTAICKKPVVGQDAAVSRDRIHLLGKTVYVMCDEVNVGIRKVVDLTSDGMVNTLDILVPTEKLANKFGEQQCDVVVLEN